MSDDDDTEIIFADEDRERLLSQAATLFDEIKAELNDDGAFAYILPADERENSQTRLDSALEKASTIDLGTKDGRTEFFEFIVKDTITEIAIAPVVNMEEDINQKTKGLREKNEDFAKQLHDAKAQIKTLECEITELKKLPDMDAQIEAKNVEIAAQKLKIEKTREAQQEFQEQTEPLFQKYAVKLEKFSTKGAELFRNIAAYTDLYAEYVLFRKYP